ncbi:hypothetical protein [Methanosarcina sp.]|uniref:hypothetical protein n=1 Tax=Methanosarcina sp. TaxID=2213 RepID=UPI003BB5259C
MTIALGEIELNWDGKVSQVLSNPYVAKMAMPLDAEESGKGIGMNTYKGLAYAPGYGGRISFKLEFDPETPHIKAKDYNVPIQQSSRVLDRRDFESYVLRGINVTSDIAVQMLDDVLEKQNLTVIDGWKPNGTYATYGMYQVANISDAGNSFATPGGAQKTVSTLIGKLQKANIYSDDGYNLFVNPDENAKVLASANATSGLREYPIVVDILNQGVADGTKPGRIIPTTAITAGTCMVAPTAAERNKKFFKLVEAQIPYNNLWYVDGNEKDGDIKARQVGSLFPTFAQLDDSGKTNCIAKGTAVA